MSRQLALINGRTLKILRETKGVSYQYLANKSGSQVAGLETWEKDLGEEYPTIRQAEKIASTLQFPLAGLYLEPENMPDCALPKTRNLRRFPIGDVPDNSAFNLAIDWLSSLRIEIIEIRNELGIPNIVANLPNIGSNVTNAANQLRQYLGLDLTLQKKCRSSRQLFLLIRKLMEKKGILLSQFHGVDLDAARGVSLYYNVLPVIGVNDEDHWPAKSFSAIHELAHLTERASSSCNQMGPDSDLSEEVFCNAVAGEFLVPKKDLMEEIGTGDPLDLDEAERLAGIFSVSRDVISRRLYDLKYIDKTQYEARVDLYNADIEAQREEKRLQREAGLPTGFPQPVERKVVDRFGSLYCETILRGIEGGIYSELDAGKTFNVSENKLRDVFSEALR